MDVRPGAAQLKQLWSGDETVPNKEFSFFQCMRFRLDAITLTSVAY